MTDNQAAEDSQARFAPAVLANDLQLADKWGQPCLCYLLFFRPDPAATAALSAVQDAVHGLEPTLLRQPEAALHGLVATVLPVSVQLEQPKDQVWSERGEAWLAAMTSAARRVEPAPARLSFRRLIVTDAAIIASADLPNAITSLRRDLAAGLDLQWPVAKGPLVHITLFRYGRPLADPATLLEKVQALDICIDTEVSELLMVRETTFPSLDYEVMHRLAIGRPGWRAS